jgi:hypothetical protein
MTGIRFAHVLKRVDSANAVRQVQGRAERFFNSRCVLGHVPTDPAVEREDTIRAAGIIRRKIFENVRGRNVFVITDGRKFGGRRRAIGENAHRRLNAQMPKCPRGQMVTPPKWSAKGFF